MSGPLKVLEYPSNFGIVEAKICDFDTNSDVLKTEHKIWLIENVVSILTNAGSATIVGEASRLGSHEDNQKLSEKRATKTHEFLKKEVVKFGKVAPTVKITRRGVGETAAEYVGLKDGTDDALHRAVRIKAWSHPVPPPAPKPIKTPPAKLVIRVVERQWGGSSISTGGPSHPREGDYGKTLGQQLEIIADAVTRGGSDQRKYAFFPTTHMVVEVVHLSEMFKTTSAIGSTLRNTRKIQYKWGPPTDRVFLKKTSNVYEDGKLSAGWSDVYVGWFERPEIWKHTTAPNVTVLGG